MSKNEAWRQTKGANVDNYKAGEALEDGLIVIRSATEGEVTKAVDATVAYAGVVCQPKVVALGDSTDVQQTGTAKVLIGGAVAYGDTLIADANGMAVQGAAGYVIGVAMQTVSAPAGGEKGYVSVSLDLHNV